MENGKRNDCLKGKLRTCFQSTDERKIDKEKSGQKGKNKRI